MIDSSIIKISSSAVANNIKVLRQLIGEDVEFSMVVKANAYGHGIEQYVPILEEQGIRSYSVFDYNEAEQVYKSLSDSASIIIMGWIPEVYMETVITKGFEFFVFNIERLELALLAAKAQNSSAKIHLEVETGMNRSGLNNSEFLEAIKIIKANPEHFELKGFCTHLAGPESIANYFRLQNQLKLYDEMLDILTSHGLKPEKQHIANSAASIVYPEARRDMVRIGIMQYGFWSSPETFIHYCQKANTTIDPLQRVLKWESKIMAIKKVKTGEFVGYGNSYLAQHDITTALIPIGYSGGYTRSLSNKGRVLIGGTRCGIIGVVNMNMIIADVTSLEDVEVGAPVVLIGKQGKLELKVQAFSNISEELNYEILAHLPHNIERKVT